MPLPVEIHGHVDVRTGLWTAEFEIPGIVAADAFDAADAFGEAFVLVDVPERGVIHYGRFVDLDDEGSQIDAYLYSGEITRVASDAAYAPTDADGRKIITVLTFDTFNDMTAWQFAEVRNHNAGYHAPDRRIYGQCKCTGTPTIAEGAMPLIFVAILPSFGTE
jgi:hypothetical protein